MAIARYTECQDHDFLATDCPHCQSLIELAEEIIELVSQKRPPPDAKRLSPRERIVVIHLALGLAIDRECAGLLGRRKRSVGGAA